MKVLIVGGGKVGTYLASLLLEGGHTVRLIEQRDEELPRLQRELSSTVVLLGSGTDPEILDRAGIRDTQVVAAVTGADETNLVVTSLARFEFRVPRTIARVNNPKNAWLFNAQMGVDVALNQAELMGHLIAEEMSLGDMMTLLKLRRGKFSLVEEKVEANAPAVGMSLRECSIPGACVAMAIIRRGELLVPDENTVIEPGDEVLAVASVDQLDQLRKLLGAGASAR
ncbi:MAG: potassium channel family protein [Anaerolineae bacterium]